MKIISLQIGLVVTTSKSKWKLTPQQISDWNCYISTVLSIISARNFILLSDYRGHDNYSYCAWFTPESQRCGKRFKLRADFSIIDDYVEGSNDNSVKFTAHYINNTGRKSFMTIIDDIGNICSELLSGNLSDFDKALKSEEAITD